MRPYWTVLKDAFHEAFASRVLWILLAIITLLLGALAPCGYRLDLLTQFRVGDFRDARRFAGRLKDAGLADEPTPAKRLWSRMDRSAQTSLATFAIQRDQGRGALFRGARMLTDEMNKVATQPDLYEASHWEGIHFRKELRDLIALDAESLTDRQIERRNRLLIEAAFRDEIEPSPANAVVFTYLGLDATPILPLTPSQTNALIEQVALNLLLNLLLSWIVLFAGILVTAPIIPQMFQTGSLHLLLSKPISRSLLFVARFLGGGAFVLIAVTYMILGLWLIAGWRFGIWNHGMLQSIPVFLFLFLIYYVISGLTGAIWKNSVVSVVLTLCAMFALFFISSAKAVVETAFVVPQRITAIVFAGESLVAVNEQGASRQWNAEERRWDDVFLTPGPPGGVRVLGPVYESESERLIAIRLMETPFGRAMPMGSNLQVGPRERGWQRTDGPRLPGSPTELLQRPGGEILAVVDQGVFRLKPDADSDANSVSVFGFSIPLGESSAFDRLTGSDWPAGGVSAADLNVSNGRLAVFDDNTVAVFDADERGRFSRAAQTTIDGDSEDQAILAFGGETVLVLKTNGDWLALDAETLSVRKQARPITYTPPRFVHASPDGRWFAVVYQDGQLWMFDAKEDRIERARVRAQGDISCAMFHGDSLFVASHGTQLDRYEPETWRSVESWRPQMSVIEWVYHYGIVPVHAVLPKPSELSETIQYLLTKETTGNASLLGISPQAKQDELDPWTPVWSSAAFIVVMLAAACFYLERQEF